MVRHENSREFGLWPNPAAVLGKEMFPYLAAVFGPIRATPD